MKRTNNGQRIARERLDAKNRLSRAKQRIRHCSICGERGHNAQTCTNPGRVPTFEDFERLEGRR